MQIATDCHERARKAALALGDETLLPWQRIEPSLSALSGLELSALPSHIREWLDRELVRINVLFAKYDVKTHDDYQRMSQDDIQDVLAGAAKVCAILRNVS